MKNIVLLILFIILSATPAFAFTNEYTWETLYPWERWFIIILGSIIILAVIGKIIVELSEKKTNHSDSYHFIGNDDDLELCNKDCHEYTGQYKNGACSRCGQYPPETILG